MRTLLTATVFLSTPYTTNLVLLEYLKMHSHGTGTFYLEPHSFFVHLYILYNTLSTLRGEALFFAYPFAILQSTTK